MAKVTMKPPWWLTQEGLFKKANELSVKHWGVPYTGAIVLVNYKWSRRNGVFSWSRDEITRQLIEQEIKMSKKVNERRGEFDTEDTLLHELVHWRLRSLDVPGSDTDPEFIAECKRVGASFSQSKKAQKALADYELAKFEGSDNQ